MTRPSTTPPARSPFGSGYPPPVPNGHRNRAQAPTFPAPPGARGWGDRLPQARRQRRPAVAVGGALLVLLCGIASVALASRGHQRLAVLALARDVPAGHVLTGQDLRVAHVAGDGVSALSAAGSGALIGQSLTATLPAGTLLNASMLSSAPVPAAGQELVAVAVKAGGVPMEATPGRDVALLRVSPPGASGERTAGQVLVSRARAVSVHVEPASGLIVLSVQVPAAAAVSVTQASTSGAVAVTLLPVAP